MDTDFEIYKGKSFKDLCKDIYSNQENRKEQIEIVISDLRPLIKTVNDAMMVVPLIKGYMDTANTNDEHLIKLAQIIQRIMNAQAQAEKDGLGFSISEDEKKALWAEVKAIQESDSVVVTKIKKESD